VDLLVSDGDPVRLIEAWSGASLAIVVDAVRAHPPRPGRLHRFVLEQSGIEPDADGWTAGPAGRTASTHGLGLDDAIGLALALGRMPRRLVVHAIEAADLRHGAELTPAVAAAVKIAADAVRRDLLHH
jgi:hydrogenase maturation protease